MWVFSKDVFLSVVAIKDDPIRLMVRARIRGDIEKVFPLYAGRVRMTPNSDYRFRAMIPRSEVSCVMAKMVKDIDYINFKDSVTDQRRHWAYSDVWVAMLRLQDQLEEKVWPRWAKRKFGWRSRVQSIAQESREVTKNSAPMDGGD